MGGVRAMLVLAAVLGALTGCKPRPPSAEELAELAQVKRESAELDAALTRVEARLLEGRTLVAQGRLLVQRHGQASQVACQNLETHWEGIAAYEAKQHEKEVKKRRQAKIAQVTLRQSERAQ